MGLINIHQTRSRSSRKHLGSQLLLSSWELAEPFLDFLLLAHFMHSQLTILLQWHVELKLIFVRVDELKFPADFVADDLGYFEVNSYVCRLQDIVHFIIFEDVPVFIELLLIGYNSVKVECHF